MIHLPKKIFFKTIFKTQQDNLGYIKKPMANALAGFMGTQVQY